MCLPPEVSDNMGCTGSIVYPTGDTIEKRKPANGVTISTKNDNPNYLKGDYSQMQFARHNRDKYVKQRQSKTFIAANELSGRILEERELLSLGTRSRGTSRNTSRTASPSSARKSTIIKDEMPGPMTPVAEDLHSQSSRRIDTKTKDIGEVVDNELPNPHLQRTFRIKSTTKPPKSKGKSNKKQKSPRTTKKAKPKKHRKGKKAKGAKSGKESLIETENIDSGLEDNVIDESDIDNSDLEEEHGDRKVSDIHREDAHDSDKDDLRQDIVADSGTVLDNGAESQRVGNTNNGFDQTQFNDVGVENYVENNADIDKAKDGGTEHGTDTFRDKVISSGSGDVVKVDRVTDETPLVTDSPVVNEEMVENKL